MSKKKRKRYGQVHAGSTPKSFMRGVSERVAREMAETQGLPPSPADSRPLPPEPVQPIGVQPLPKWFGPSHQTYVKPEPPKPCCVCGGREKMTDHHLVPLASRWRLAAARSEPATVPLCERCHVMAHQHFGEGHVWDGPVTTCGLVNELRGLLRFRESARPCG